MKKRTASGGKETAVFSLNSRKIRLTNLEKPFWPDIGITKGDFL